MSDEDLLSVLLFYGGERAEDSIIILKKKKKKKWRTHRWPWTQPPSAPFDERPTAGKAAAAACPRPPPMTPRERERAALGAVSERVTRHRQAWGVGGWGPPDARGCCGVDVGAS